MHCTCTKCTDCICPVCTKWTKVISGKYLSAPANYQDPYLLIYSYHTGLVLQNIIELGQWWRGLLAKEPVAIIQAYLTSLSKSRGKQLTFVGVHVRRTDYIKFMERRFQMLPGKNHPKTIVHIIPLWDRPIKPPVEPPSKSAITSVSENAKRAHYIWVD